MTGGIPTSSRTWIGRAMATHSGAPRRQPERDASEDRNAGDRQCLPAHRGRRFTGTHAEGAEHAEVAATTAHREHQRVGDGNQPEAGDGDPDGSRNLAHVAQAS